MRVLTLLPVLGHVRDSKRIDMLRAQGATVEVAAFNRPHPVNRAPRCPVTLLGNINNAQYLRRIFAIICCLPKVITLAKRNDIIYASGQDMGFLAIVAGSIARKPVVMEVGDIREIQLNYGIVGDVVRSVERWMTDHFSFVILTAEGFLTGYYGHWLRKSPDHLIIENKLEESFVAVVEAAPPTPRPALTADAPIVIGYFGLLRYQWSIDALAVAIKHGCGRIKVVLAGAASEGVDIRPLTDGQEGLVEYLGAYRSPEDLKAMYEKIDIVWCCNPISCQDSSGANWAWARTNRFYESCLFQKPLIVLNGIGDAPVVEKYGIGIVLQGTAMDCVRHCIDSLSEEAIMGWRAAFAQLPRSLYSYTDEAARLSSKMRHAASLPSPTSTAAQGRAL